MRILGISCSPRKGKTTYRALAACLEAAREARPAAATEIVELSDFDIGGCRACGQCKGGLTCSIADDFARLIPRLVDQEVSGMVVATPVYLGSMTSLCKAFLERTVMFRRNGFLFRDRAGGVLAVGGIRNGGQELTIQAVQAALLVHDMVIVGDGKDTAHFGGTLWNAGDRELDADEFGMKTARNLGRRVAEMAHRINP